MRMVPPARMVPKKTPQVRKHGVGVFGHGRVWTGGSGGGWCLGQPP